MVDETLYAGYLCSTHIGKVLLVTQDGEQIEGVCHAITLTTNRPTVRVILHERDEIRRKDGGMRKVHHCLDLDPRAVVVVVED
jgi:hypothetical protein